MRLHLTKEGKERGRVGRREEGRQRARERVANQLSKLKLSLECGMVKGVRLEKEEELKEGIGFYFKSMFEETQVRRPMVDLGLFGNLDSLDNEALEGSFSKEEVTKALSNLGGGKALGLDGFSMAF